MLKILDAIPLILELGVEFFKFRNEGLKLKNKLLVYELTDKIENKIDKLNEKRSKLRDKHDSTSQDEASKLMTEILDEQVKLKIFLADQKISKP